jgi:hypothetical protein
LLDGSRIPFAIEPNVEAPVPRFFFDVIGATRVADTEGQLLPDMAAALREALRSARVLACEEVGKGLWDLTGGIEVRNEAGSTAAVVTFGEALDREL